MKLKVLHRLQLGKLGEDLAATYLIRHGYRLIEKNFKARYGEIDLICQKNHTLIYVEVKARMGRAYGTPEESVTTRKLAEVIKTAQYYRLTHAGLPEAEQIDVIGIELDDAGNPIHFNHLQSVTS